MPQLIDELIVSLSLDPSKFSSEQKRALESLRTFKQDTKEATKSIAANTQEYMHLFFRALENPLAAAENLFVKLGSSSEQASRGVSTVSVDAKAATTDVASLTSGVAEAADAAEALAAGAGLIEGGLAGMTTAGLLAIGAFQGLKLAIAAIAPAQAWGQSIAFAQQWFGIPDKLSSTLAIAAYEQEGVPKEQTIQSLESMSMSLGAFQAGIAPIPSGMNDMLTRLGISAAEPFPQIMKELPAALANFEKMYGPAATEYLGVEGGLPAGVVALMAHGKSYAAAMKEAGLDAVTPKEANTMEAFGRTLRGVDVAVTNLTLDLSTDFVNILNWISTKIAVIANAAGLNFVNRETGTVPGQVSGSMPLANPPGSAMPGAGPGIAFRMPTPEQAATLKFIEQKESGGQDVMNAEGSGAAGYWQFMPETWREMISQFQGGQALLAQYPTAITAPLWLQEQAALLLMQERGIHQWSSMFGYTPQSALAASGYVPPTAPTLSPANSTVHLGKQLSMIGAIGAGASTSTAMNNSNNTMHGGPVTINVNGARNPGRVAQQIKLALAGQRSQAFNIGYD